MKRFLLIVLAIVLPACAPAIPQHPWTPRSAEWTADSLDLPITILDGAATIPVFINGQGPFTFMIDTGAAAFIVSDSLARKLGLRELPNVHLVDALADGRTIDSDHRIAPFASITLGNSLQLRDAYIRIAPDDASLFKHPRVDGIAGFPLFQNQVITLDLVHQRLHAEPSASLATLPPDDPTLYPLKSESGVPQLSIALAKDTPEEQHLNLTLDTGCKLPLVLPASAREALGPPLAKGTMDTTTIYGKEPAEIEFHRTPIQFPGILRNNHMIAFAARSPVYAIGFPILRNYIITFDPAAKLMRMQYIAPPATQPATTTTKPN